MADEFSIDIVLNADLSRFRQEVKQEMEQVAKGVTVPVRTTAAEQAAVDRAMSQVQSRAEPRTPRGGGASLAMANATYSGGRLPPRTVTPTMAGGAEPWDDGAQPPWARHTAGLSRDAYRTEIDRAWAGAHPRERAAAIDMYAANSARVERNWDAAGMAAQRAQERAEAQARRAQERSELQAERRAQRTSERFQRSAVDLAERGILDAPSLDDIAELGGGRRHIPFAGGPPRPRERGAGSVLTGARLFRAAASALAVTEASNAIESYRQGVMASQYAGTPEEAILARAQTREQAYSGLILGTLSAVPNLLDLAGSPQGAERRAREAVMLRQSQDARRTSMYGVAQDEAYRTGYARGGVTGGEGERRVLASRQRIEQLGIQYADTQQQLSLRTPSGLTFDPSRPLGSWWHMGDKQFVTGDARNELEGRASDIIRQTNNESANITQANLEDEKRRAAARLQNDASVRRLGMVAAGAPDRSVLRRELSDRVSARAMDYAERFGGAAEGQRRNIREAEAESAAMESGFTRQDRLQNFSLRAEAQQSRLLGMNQPIQAQLAGAMNQAAQQRIQAQIAGNLGFVGGAINEQLSANVGGILAGAGRQFGGQMLAMGGQRNQLQAMLNRNPEGAEIASIRAQRDLALRDTESDLPGMGFLRRIAINANAGMQERLTRRGFAEQRFETSESLGAATRQSRFRELGGAYRVDAALDDIVSSTNADARALRSGGDARGAVMRNNLGVQQLREARANYFRSVDFEEVEGGRIAGGRGDSFRGIEKKFRDAEDKIGGAAGRPGGSDAKPMNEKQGEQLIQLLGQFLTKHFRAKTT